MIERTLVLVKPDGVKRAIVGKVIQRLEDAGMKPVGMKMVWADEDLAKKHYGEDVLQRRGEFVRNKLVHMLTKEGPVIAMVLEGLHAVEIVRKLAGATQGKEAAPGTIRGDFSVHSFDYADSKEIAIRNVVHASASPEEAKDEIGFWFAESELYEYPSVHDMHL